MNRAKYFAKYDLVAGFYQIELHKDSREFTAFETNDGVWMFKRMAQGLRSSVEHFQRTVTKALQSMVDEKEIEIYIEDLFLWAEHEDELLKKMNRMFELLQKVGIKLSKNTCEFNEMG